MDKKTILAFLLIGLVIIFMPYYYQLISPPKENETEKSLVDTLSTAKSNSVQTTQEVEKGKIPVASDKTVDVSPVEKIPEKEFIIDTDLYTAQISNRNGGTIKKIYLKKYLTITRDDTHHVQLIPQFIGSYPFLIEFLSMDGDSIRLENNFRIVTPLEELPGFNSDTLRIQANQQATIQFETSLNPEYKIKKALAFSGSSYKIKLTINAENLVDILPTREFRLVWPCGVASTEPSYDEDMNYTRAYAYIGGELENVNAKIGKVLQSQMEGNTDWVAIRNKYFVAAMIPEHPASSFLIKGFAYPPPPEKKQPYKIFYAAIDIPVKDQSRTTKTVDVFIGPLDYRIVKSLNVNLDRVMNFGASFIRPISKGILNLFTWMHSFIPNYGIVLIIFSILIKAVLFPLTHKSFISMKRLQSLQPLITELKEKYSNDPKRFQIESMNLYKTYKVNPLGGCLPMLLQLPLLWALFIVFRTTIELRNAPFMLWITDLSSPDTIFTLPFSIPFYGNAVNVLPIIMVLTMILQQKQSTTTTTQQQKIMMYAMPVIFFMIFNQFPSGLNLYYTLFNVLTILQQKYLIKIPEIEIKPLEKKPARGKRPRKR